MEAFAIPAFARVPASSVRFVRRVDELVPQQARTDGTLAAVAALDVIELASRPLPCMERTRAEHALR